MTTMTMTMEPRKNNVCQKNAVRGYPYLLDAFKKGHPSPIHTHSLFATTAVVGVASCAKELVNKPLLYTHTQHTHAHAHTD